MASAANTPANHYLDTPSKRVPCAKDFAKIEKACKPESDNSDKNRSPTLKKLLGKKRADALAAVMSKAKSKYSGTADNAWLEHCDGLWIKPSNGNVAEDFNRQLQDIANDLSGNIDNLLKPLLEKVGQEIKDAAWEAAKDKGVKMGARAGGRWVVGAAGGAVAGVGAIVTEAIATAWNIVDLVGTGYDMGKLAYESRAAINEIKALMDIAKGAQRELDTLARNASSMSPTDLMGNAMGVLSKLNPCTRARRCLLVPYRKTSTMQSLNGSGCCPGQTGHHVIPEESVGSCVNYSHGAAPTLCVEGTTNANGTHGKIHSDLGRRIYEYKDGFLGERKDITYGKMRDIGIASVMRSFPESKCDIGCLRAQLDSYYKDKCKKPMKPAAGLPGKPNSDGEQGPVR